MSINIEIEWKKQPRQIDFLRAAGLSYPFDGGGPKPPQARILMYGGSAGGGKSDTLLMLAFIAAITYPGCNIAIFRREYPQLEGPGGLIMRSHELFNLSVGEDQRTKLAKWHGGKRRWTFFNNSVIQFEHCKTDGDVYNYQSQQFDYLLLDESTQFTEYQLQYLMTRNRLTVDGPTQALCGLATNPGGVSHGYHKKMFIECGPPGQPVYVEVQKGKHQVHLFIPSRLSDNQVLEERDPGYRQTLEAMPEDLRKALLEGDWDVFAGKYFREFSREHHVIEPFEIPDHWLRFGSLDWGFAAPASFLWHTIEPSSGRVYTYRELYISKMRAGELAKEILEMSHGELLQYIKISPDAYKEAGLGTNVAPGETVADEFLKVGLNVEPADNRRILGWQRMREYMSLAPDDKPWWQIFNTCSNLIRTLPELTHDKYRVEDISADCEDHAPESARYYLMSRPSPLEGASFYAGSREQFRDMTDDDEDDLHDMGYGGVTFYGL